MSRCSFHTNHCRISNSAFQNACMGEQMQRPVEPSSIVQVGLNARLVVSSYRMLWLSPELYTCVHVQVL